MTENSDKLDNMTVRRFAKLIKGNSTNNGSTGITTGTVIQNDNQLYVAVDDETLVPVSDTASNVNVGDKVTLAIDNEEALIVGNNSDASPTASELSETDTKATFAKVDASEAKDTAQTAQVTANTAQNTAETAQTTADNAQSTATEAKETADAVDGKATEAKETATQAQATATTASETATQAQTTANTAKETADTASTKADNAQSTADTASSKADNAQSTADTASTKADNAQSTADTASSKADTAQASADDARKYATNYIDFDDTNGLVIGDKREDATLTANTQINSEGVHIRDGETVLASFEDNEINLGKNSETSTINLCNNRGIIRWDNNSKTFSFTAPYNNNVSIGMKTETINSSETITSDSYIYMLNNGFFWKGGINSCSTEGYCSAKDYNYLFYEDGQLRIQRQRSDDVNPPSVPCINIFDAYNEGYVAADILYQSGEKVSVEGHTHTQSDITDFAHTHTKSDITDFSHTHTKSEISDFEHDHTGEDLYPYSVHAKNDIRVHDTVVSLNGHTHVMDDITDFTQKMFMTKSFNVSYTLPANTLKDVTISNKVNGYTAIGVFDYSTSSGGVFPARISVGRAGTATFGLKNTTSSQISKTLGVNFLYVKSDFFDKYN